MKKFQRFLFELSSSLCFIFKGYQVSILLLYRFLALEFVKTLIKININLTILNNLLFLFIPTYMAMKHNHKTTFININIDMHVLILSHYVKIACFFYWKPTRGLLTE